MIQNKQASNGAKRTGTGATTATAASTSKTGGGRRQLGTVKKNGKGTVYAVLNKKVELYFDGKKIDLGENNVLFFTTKEKALSDVDYRVEKGYMSEKAEQVSREILANEEVKYILEANLVASAD